MLSDKGASNKASYLRMGLKNRRDLVIAIVISISLMLALAFFIYQKSGHKFNVILITIDALRPDHLSCYGYNRNTSPNIDKLAREGIMFTQAISASSSTISSVPSIMTSVYPDMHGIWEFGNSLDPNIISLGGLLRKNGFFTGIISAQLFPHLTSRTDFISKKIKLDAKANEITDWAIKWLVKNKKKKLFLYLHYFDPHGPYTPPSPYNGLYLNDKFYERGIEVPLLERKRGGFGGIPGYQAQNEIKEKSYYIAEYDGEICFADAQIGRLINALEEMGLLDKTMVIITADHGESLGEHGYYFDHGFFLYDNLIKVPLIIYYKSLMGLNKIINQQISQVDIMPTILDVENIRLPKEYKIEGVSLTPLIFKGKGHAKTYVISEYFEGGAQKFAIRENGWKLILNAENGSYELYNLKGDPAELNNLFSVEKEVANNFKHTLDLLVRRSVNKLSHAKIELNERDKEKLKSLGYLN